jgi:hypothetical protein
MWDPRPNPSKLNVDDVSWLRDARQAELQRLFAYVVLVVTIFLGEGAAWSALAQAQRSQLPPSIAVVGFVIGADFLLFAFGFAAIARYDLVGRIEAELEYPSSVIALLTVREPDSGVVGSKAWLSREYVFMGTKLGNGPGELRVRGPLLDRLQALSSARVWLPRTGLAVLTIGMSWFLLRFYWPWL